MDGSSSGPDDLVGMIVQDRYRVQRLLATGCMGEVYEVEHVKIGRRLALKRLSSQYSDDETLLERFHREARVVSLVGNRHIAEVTDMGELEDGSPYIVLELLDGEDLGSVLQRERALDVGRAVGMGADRATSHIVKV